MSLTFKVTDETGIVQELELRGLSDEQAIALNGSVRTHTGQINTQLLLVTLRQNWLRGSQQLLTKYANAIGERLLGVEVKVVLREPAAVALESHHLGITARHTFRRLSVSEVLEMIRIGRSGCPRGVPRRQWANLRALDQQWRRFHCETSGYENRSIPLIVRSRTVVKLGEVEAESAIATGETCNPK